MSVNQLYYNVIVKLLLNENFEKKYRIYQRIVDMTSMLIYDLKLPTADLIVQVQVVGSHFSRVLLSPRLKRHAQLQIHLVDFVHVVITLVMQEYLLFDFLWDMSRNAHLNKGSVVNRLYSLNLLKLCEKVAYHVFHRNLAIML